MKKICTIVLSTCIFIAGCVSKRDLGIQENVLEKSKEQNMITLYSSDPLKDKQWYLGNRKTINTAATSKNDMVIALIDTGVDYQHEDLRNSNSLWVNTKEVAGDGIDTDLNGYIDDIYGWNFCEGNNMIDSFREEIYENDHGTMCFGIIAAELNTVGVRGVASSHNIKIMVLKVLDGLDHTGNVNNIIEAINYAEKMGANICNLSFITKKDNPELKNCIQNSNMLFVVGAGNDGKNITQYPVYPAKYALDNIITVGAIDCHGKIYENSNYSNIFVDILAPGVDIYSTGVNCYMFDSGTSFAVPMVTAKASILYSANENLTAKELKYLLLQKSEKDDSLLEFVKGGRKLDMDM